MSFSPLLIVAGKWADVGLLGFYDGHDQNTFSECVQWTCVAETAFLYHMSQMLLPGSELGVTAFDENNGNLHSNGFDNEFDCPVEQGANDPERQCCGSYPTRFPFKPLNGARKCCDDGTVRTYGYIKPLAS